MAVTINADNGVSSGSAGLKQTADSTGVLALQTNGTTAVSISTGQVVSLTQPLPVASGGTGTTSNAAAPFALKGANSDITSLSGLTTPLSVAQGGTGTTSTTFVNLTTNVTGTLPVANGGTGTTSTTFVNLATNVTGTLPVANGGTGTTSTTFANLTTNVTGTLPVANGGTGVTTSTGSGANVLGTSPTLTTPTINSAQVATVSGTAPLYMCRAWVNFNGSGTVAGSGNVTSVTRNTTGDFTVNFTTGMPDASYSCVTSAARTINNAFMSSIYYSSGLATGSARVRCWEDAGAAQDPNVFCVSIFR